MTDDADSESGDATRRADESDLVQEERKAGTSGSYGRSVRLTAPDAATVQPTDEHALPASCSCKLGNVVREFDLTDAHRDIVARWVAGEGVRRLAAEFNKELLRRELSANDFYHLSGEVNHFYDVLNGDGADASDVNRVKHRLRDHGIDPEGLTDAFVSYGTVYRHVTGCLDVERDDESGSSPSVETAGERIRKLQRRTGTITENAIESLLRHDEVMVGDDDFEVFVSVSVYCPACGTQRTFQEFLDRGGCACDRHDPPDADDVDNVDEGDTEPK